MKSGIVERLVVAIGFDVDKSGVDAAMGAYADIAASMIAATTAIAGFAIAQAAADDELTKTAHELGATTEAYTELAHAMNMDGVSDSQLATSFRGLQTQLEASARGSGEAPIWFEKMGIATKDAATGGVRLAMDAIGELSDGLAGLSIADQRAAGLKIFGRAGQRMALALSQGSEAINALKADAHKLGIVLTEDAGKRAEALTDSMTRVHAAMSGVARGVADSISPALTELGNQFVEVVTAENGFIHAGADRVAGMLGFAFEGLTNRTGKAVAAIALLGATSKLQKLVSSVPILGEMASSMGVMSAKGLASWGVLGLGVLAIDDLATAARGGDSAIMDLAAAFGVEDEAMSALNATIQKGSDLMGMLSAFADANVASFRFFGEQWTSMVDAINSSPLASILSPAIDALETMFILLQSILSAVTDFKSATQGFANFAKWMGGDTSIKLVAPGTPSGPSAPDIIRRQQQVDVASRVAPLLGVQSTPASGVTINPIVNVSTGLSAEDVANEAAQKVRDMTMGAYAMGAF